MKIYDIAKKSYPILMAREEINPLLVRESYALYWIEQFYKQEIDNIELDKIVKVTKLKIESLIKKYPKIINLRRRGVDLFQDHIYRSIFFKTSVFFKRSQILSMLNQRAPCYLMLVKLPELFDVTEKYEAIDFNKKAYILDKLEHIKQGLKEAECDGASLAILNATYAASIDQTTNIYKHNLELVDDYDIFNFFRIVNGLLEGEELKRWISFHRNYRHPLKDVFGCMLLNNYNLLNDYLVIIDYQSIPRGNKFVVAKQQIAEIIHTKYLEFFYYAYAFHNNIDITDKQILAKFKKDNMEMFEAYHSTLMYSVYDGYVARKQLTKDEKAFWKKMKTISRKYEFSYDFCKIDFNLLKINLVKSMKS